MSKNPHVFAKIHQERCCKWESADDIEAEIQLPVFPNRDYLVTNINSENALPAIQKMIDSVNVEGGGRVVIPPGIWNLEGPIHLKSNINLHIQDGAELIFSNDPEDYLPQVLTRWEGTEAFNLSPLIYGYQVHNVAITGKGVLNGNSELGFATWRDKQKNAQELLRNMGNTNVPLPERVFGLEDYLRPSFIQFFGSSRILIDGVKIQNSPMWCNHFIYSNNISVRNIVVNSHRLNNDGVVIDSSTLVLIEGNSFSTGDDSIVIKSGRDREGREIAKPSEGILIRRNYMEGHNALAIGSEISGGVQHVFMENNKLGEVNSAIYFKSNLDRGGFIKHVRVSDITVDTAAVLLRFDTDYHSYKGGRFPTLYQDFIIQNVSAKNTDLVFEIKGVEMKPIKLLEISNVSVLNTKEIAEIRNVEHLVFQNITINGKKWD